MKFGIMFANTLPFNEADDAVALATGAEAAGFESLWTAEHVVWPTSYDSPYPYSRSGKMPGEESAPLPDPIVWLTWVAAHTQTIRLATGILILPQRNPLVTAKELSTLDQLSGGRVELGIGIGWLREEFEALGVPFERRGERMDEYVAAMRVAWTEDDASFAGEFVSYSGINVNPKPLQAPIPITVGGHSPAAARRAGRYAEGLFPALATEERLQELVPLARGSAEAEGRDPALLEFTAGTGRSFISEPASVIEPLAGLGVTRLVVPAFYLLRPDLETALGKIAEVITEFG